MEDLGHANFEYGNEQRSWLHGVTDPESKLSQDYHSLDQAFVTGAALGKVVTIPLRIGDWFVQASLHVHKVHILQAQRLPIGTKTTIVQEFRQRAP